MIQTSDTPGAPVRRAAKRPATTRQAQSWVVMTSWILSETTTEELTQDSTHPGATRMTVTVSRSPQPGRSPSHQVSPRYAAVPTDLGWLIVEL
jgi:hypothetical protein